MDDIYYYSKFSLTDSILNKVKRAVTSIMMLLLAFAIANMTHQLVLGLLCKAFGYTTKIGLHYVSAAPHEYIYWSSLRVLVIYGFPPVFCLVLAFFINRFLLSNDNYVQAPRMFFYWLQTCFTMLFAVQLFIMPFGTSPHFATGFYQTFSIIATWFHVPAAFLVVFTFISAILALAWGFFTASEIQRFSFSSKALKTFSGRNAIVMQVYLLPAFVAVPFIILFSNTWSFMVHGIYTIMFLLPAIGMYIRHRVDMRMVRCNKEDVLNRWPVIELGMAAAAWGVIFLFFNS